MTRHVDDLRGLLAEPGVFYGPRRLGETAAYAFEWINAFGHVTPGEREGLQLHGGTPAQLYLGEQQRFSRDVDLIGRDPGRIERVLDAVAQRYDGRLFRWEETPVEGAEIPLQRFSAYFRNAGGVEIPLKVDVTYLQVTLDTATVSLARSAAYRPRDIGDAIETLTPQAFIADKLPTLGFDTLGYRRVADALGHPEHVWKQLHDISRLVAVSGDLSRVLALYEAGIAARNAARGLAHGPDACLDDAYRVAMVALAAAVFPYNHDRPGDDHYAGDVEHVRSGLGRYREHLLGTATLLDDATTTALLVRGLRSARRGEVAIVELVPALARIRLLRDGFAGSAPLRAALRARFDTAADPAGWEAPVSSRRLYRARPSAAITAWVAANVVSELRELTHSGRFTFEPGSVVGLSEVQEGPPASPG